MNELKVKGKRQKWESIRKAVKSVRSKENIEHPERRLSTFRAEINLRIVVELREQVSKSNLEQLGCLGKLDSTTMKILGAITQQQDVFAAVKKIQLTLQTVWRRQEQRISLAEQDQYLSKLPAVPQAAFNCFDKRHNPICLPETRVDLLREIITWADELDERCIFWLSGLAGTGKSTIARTVVQACQGKNRLGASFFFSRGGGDTSHAGKFFASIARQLANMSPSLRQYICEAIAEHSDISDRSLRDQWYQLIFRPLSQSNENSPQSPLVLVVDALDECDDEKDIRTIIQLLAEARSLTGVRLRIFITSRPEIPIRQGLYQIPEAGHQDCILHNISPAVVNHDISLFLEHNFGTIRAERGLSANWPGDLIIRRLVRNACGLFIWAATACRFVSQGKQFAARRLSIILKEEASSIAPEKTLNEIYTTVLINSVSQDYDNQEKKEVYNNLKRILGSIVVLLSPLSAIALATLLNIPMDSIDQTLENLHAILDIPQEHDRPIRLHHPSFREFLLDGKRCNDANLQVDE